MKNTLFVLGAVLLLIVGISFTGCNGSAEQKEQTKEVQEQKDHHQHAAVFACPMKCEGDKTYDKAGKCPVCGMDLEKMEANGKADDHAGHSHDEHEGHSH